VQSTFWPSRLNYNALEKCAVFWGGTTTADDMLSLDRQEDYRRRYAVERPGWRPASHMYRDRVAGHLGPAVRVLDLGCGRGGVLEELHGRAGFAAGLDPDPRSLREHRLPGLPRAAGRAEALPYPAAAFDLVCCSWVLEHLADPARALAEVARVLVPGGRFVFLTPNRLHPLLVLNRALRSSGGLVRRLYGRAEADIFPALYRANDALHLRRALEAVGLELTFLVRVGDPTYLAFNEPLYRFASLLERLTPPALRVHLVGEASKPT